MLYTSLILLIFDYLDHIYNCSYTRDQLILQRLQNQTLKNIFQADRCPTTVVHKRLHTQYLSTRRLIHMSIEMYKVHNNIMPANIQQIFRKTSTVSTYQTRCQTVGSFVILKCRLEYGKQNFGYRGTKIWDLIPQEIRKISSRPILNKTCCTVGCLPRWHNMNA